MSLAVIQAALMAAKELKNGAEPLGKLIQSLGSETIASFNAKGKAGTCCHKCGSDWMIHTFYTANTNYSQCNSCGK